MQIPKALTIAGSDSSGGAGIQADLKTFAAQGVYGCSVITAITAQNTMGVFDVYPLPPGIIKKQLEAVLSDIHPDGIKIGMLANSSIIHSVADTLRQFPKKPLVLDPVMAAKSGDLLLEREAVRSLREELFPLTCILTPNIPEAEYLIGNPIQSAGNMREAARKLLEMGVASVLIKGGHAVQQSPAQEKGGRLVVDLFYDGKEMREIKGPRIDTLHTHGTGCTLSSAIAAGLAKGLTPLEAILNARDYLTAGLQNAYPVGKGKSPLHHFYRWWGNEETKS
jgi:hydroxymethylpyrimidine/phosphomethylpyrimidine kinase